METNQNIRAGFDTSQIEDRVREMEQRAGERLRDVRARAGEYGDQLATLVRQRPGACLAGAFFIGYLIARIARD